MNSSNNQTPETLATPREDKKRNIDPLVELANLRDDAAAFERFARRWPLFADVLDDDPSDNLGFSYGERLDRMPPSVPKRFLRIWQRRQVLREIWRGNSKRLTDVLLPPPHEVQYFPDPDYPWPPQLELDWQHGEFVYIPRTEFDEAVYRLFRRSAFVKLCANRNCPTPYFIAHKTTQRYCSESCAEVLQRAYKLQWWKEHGSERRRKKSRGKRGKR